MSKYHSLVEALGERGRLAVLRHRDDPTLGFWVRPGSSYMAMTLPDAQARKQWCRLAKIGVYPITVEAHEDGTHVVYGVHPSTALS